jgi:putative ABC transport system ATP-binding protein
MDDEPFIRCEGLVKTYKVANLEVVALQGLDLVIQRGELMGIVGTSGSGKSTLMNILGGLDLPSAGQVWVDGIDLLKISAAALDRYRSTRVGFVWQQGARNLIPSLSALENVRLPVILAEHSQVNASPRAAELLEAVGLTERHHHRLEDLSGGEQQRVAIAVALANHPVLLLADEPAGEVDPATAGGIYNVFQDLNKQFGLTTIIASRDPTIGRYADRVVVLHDGRTSAETSRQPAGQAQPAAGANERVPSLETFEEGVLLDSTGRLQIPPNYLEHFNIRGRARVELTEHGILIVPTTISANAGETAAAPTFASGTPAQAAPTSRPSAGLSGLLNRLRGRSDRK